jgi:transposase
MFAQGEVTAQVAARLRVSEKSVRQWRRAWKAGGDEALASTGAGGSACKLTDEQLLQLTEVLDAGPAGRGWVDQRWTLARIAEVIRQLFGVDYTLRGVSYLLHRIGYTVQVPARRAVERDPEQIAGWRRRRWPAVKD